MSEHCPICHGNAEFSSNYSFDGEKIECTQCGTYSISRTLLAEIKYSNLTLIKKNKISSWISEQNKIFNIKNPQLLSGSIELILNAKNKKLSEKFNCVMKTLKSKPTLNYHNFNHCYITSPRELSKYLKQAKKLGYTEMVEPERIDTTRNFNPYLLYDGELYIENLSQTNINSKNIFCAFHFTDELQKIFDTEIKKTIESLNYSYSRVSSSTTETDKKIDDEIISLIRSARIVIADFTGQRNSVYFEAGLAMGLNIPVIWTCKEDEIEKLSFDTRQYPHIVWKDAEELAIKIKNKIKAMP